jgi:hypothetical protein
VSRYDAVASLPLTITHIETTSQSRATSSGFERHTTTVHLQGRDEVGRGEDVSYEQTDHEAVAAHGLPDLTGEYTVDSFSKALDRTDLFPGTAPSSEAARHYRRWALESAALDLALRQSETSLDSLLDTTYEPIRFVVSTRLEGGDPSRVTDLLDRYPETEFKLDPTGEWDEDTISTLAATDAIRILDLKGQYEGVGVDQPADRGLYRTLFDAFPEAIIEDPDVTAAVESSVASVRDRLAWDAPVTDVEALDALPFEPTWLNVKPSRFGSVAALLETLDYCERRDIACYGGGQFELDVGRSHAQALASLFYPSGPNDLAPGIYNDPEIPGQAPSSPLPRFETSPGLPR